MGLWMWLGTGRKWAAIYLLAFTKNLCLWASVVLTTKNSSNTKYTKYLAHKLKFLAERHNKIATSEQNDQLEDQI